MEMSDEEFNQITGKIQRICGILIPHHKKNMVYSRIIEKVKELKMSSFSEYINYIDNCNDKVEIQKFCNSLTTNLTSYFRESHHFEHFAHELRACRSRGVDEVRVWSAGCSTGEEPYSLACTALSVDEEIRGLSIKILATDVDTEVLDQAKNKRVFEKQKIEISDNVRNTSRMLERDDNGGFIFSSDVRSLIQFNRLNLIESWPIKKNFDFIFCRNVVIYFSEQSKSFIVNRLVNQLNPGGYLYLGHSEIILEEIPSIELVGKTIYKKEIELS